jgi:hypothetical protein
MTGLVARLKAGKPFDIENLTRNRAFRVGFALSERQLEVLLAGGLINHIRHIRQTAGDTAP